KPRPHQAGQPLDRGPRLVKTDSSSPTRPFAEVCPRRSQKKPEQRQRDRRGEQGSGATACAGPRRKGSRFAAAFGALAPRRLRGRRIPGGRSEANGEPAIRATAPPG